MGWILFGALLIAQLALIELGFSVFSKVKRQAEQWAARQFRDEVPLEQEFAAHPILIEARSNLEANRQHASR